MFKMLFIACQSLRLCIPSQVPPRLGGTKQPISYHFQTEMGRGEGGKREGQRAGSSIGKDVCVLGYEDQIYS